MFVHVAGLPDLSIKRLCTNKACLASCYQWYADIERHAPGALSLETRDRLVPVGSAFAPKVGGVAVPVEGSDSSPAPGAAPLRHTLTAQSTAFTFAASTNEPLQASKPTARPDAETPNIGSDDQLEEAQVTQVCVSSSTTGDRWSYSAVTPRRRLRPGHFRSLGCFFPLCSSTDTIRYACTRSR